MNIIDITIDLETTALTPHAAIMQLAAVAWDRNAETIGKMFLTDAKTAEDTQHFCRTIDINEQFVCGQFDFDPQTSRWWGSQNDEAKATVLNTNNRYFLKTALVDLDHWLREIKSIYKANHIYVWCQGTDFDIPILRHAAMVNGCDKLLPTSLPHKFYRDCRTALYEAVNAFPSLYGLYTSEDYLEDPTRCYEAMPPLPESFGTREQVHGALYDCIRSSWYTWQALSIFHVSADSSK